jgi:hypothetical protein
MAGLADGNRPSASQGCAKVVIDWIFADEFRGQLAERERAKNGGIGRDRFALELPDRDAELLELRLVLLSQSGT